MAHFEKYTKEECEYGPGDWPKECGTCAHYTELSKATHRSPEGQGNCKIVVGRIDPTGLCKFHVYAKGKEKLEDQEGGEEVEVSGRAPSGSSSLTYEDWIQRRERDHSRVAARMKGRTSKEFIRGREWCDICKMWHDPGHSH